MLFLYQLMNLLQASGPPDTTPNQFTFTDQADVSLSTVIVSNSVTIAGINAAAAISVSGGEYSVNGAAFVSSPGTVVLNDTVRVRHTSSSANSTAVNTLLTVDVISDTFTSTTLVAQGPITSSGGRKRDGRRRGFIGRWMNRG